METRGEVVKTSRMEFGEGGGRAEMIPEERLESSKRV